MIKFAKGQQVWELGSWDGKGVFYYRLMTVQSWGAAQGTLTKASDGHFAKHRVYTKYVNQTDCLRSHGGVHYFAATEGFNPEAKALELAALFIQQQLALVTSLRDHPGYHQPGVEERISYFTSATPGARAY